MTTSLLIIFLLSCSASWALSPPRTNQSRRVFLSTSAVNAALGLPSAPALASLLEEFGSDPSDIKQASKAESVPTIAKKKAESNIEPNLRSNYYYPTNKVRYLPRIKKCADAIPNAASAIGNGDWEYLEEFCNKIADDTVLPMKLYTSSLLGGGTNVKVAYAKDMNQSTDDFAKYEKKLLTSVLRRDPNGSSQALEGLAGALQKYREAGRLLGPDGGGDIPSVDDIRRAASRTTGNFYGTAVSNRDARVQQKKL